MPQTLPLSHAGLSIELDRASYRPGDVITGRVVRRWETTCPRALVTVSFHGRAKSKFQKGKNEFRGRYTLIDGSKNTEQIYDGPIHIPPGWGSRGEWPFTFTVPFYGDPRCLPTEDQEKFSFLNFCGMKALPPSFTGISHSKLKEGFVEYYITADIQLHGQASHGNSNAIMPVKIVVYHPETPIRMNRVSMLLNQISMNRWNSLESVEGDNLVPGFDRNKITTSQKFKNIFKGSPLPRMSFRVSGWFPTILQMDQLDCIPFNLRVAPVWDQTSEVLQNVPQTFRLMFLDIELQTRVEIRNEGVYQAQNADWTWPSKLRFRETAPHGILAIDLPFGEESNTLREDFDPLREESDTLNVGQLLNLRMQTTKEMEEEKMKPGFQPLFPEFTTYNIKVRHYLKGKLHIKVADHSVFVTFNQDIRVLPPSDPSRGERTSKIGENVGTSSSAGIQPPPPYEEPPTFSQVMKE